MKIIVLYLIFLIKILSIYCLTEDEQINNFFKKYCKYDRIEKKKNENNKIVSL